MPRKAAAVAEPPEEFARDIVDVDLVDEMMDSFMPYALSTIGGRAIPDVRDGLKPVQRRILHAMHELGLSPDGGYRKSAGVVGEVMGKFHPHGDSAIYEAMVRMGQDVSSQMPLVDPRGNFGGLDDPPAAYRYTEARLSTAAVAMLDGIAQNAVDFVGTFDGARQEPEVLPATLPNLLVNGADGIAVGVSTSIPPHNVDEVVKAVTLWLKAKAKGGSEPTLKALMKAMPGPDFPSGGVLTGDIAEAYRTGRGHLRLRARSSVEAATSRRKQIVFTELPYRIGAERVMEEIRKAVDKGTLKCVADVSNLSGPDGAAVAVVLTTGTDPEQAADNLYARTSLEITVSIHSLALVGGAPQTLSLREMIAMYADHLSDITYRRAVHVRDQAERRAHMLRGLLLAVARIEEVIAVIREADSTAEARQGLMNLLDVDEAQADAILDMRLRRLSSLEEETLRSDLRAQEDIIKDRTEVIDNQSRLHNEAAATMQAAAKELAAPRRTEIVAG